MDLPVSRVAVLAYAASMQEHLDLESINIWSEEEKKIFLNRFRLHTFTEFSVAVQHCDNLLINPYIPLLIFSVIDSFQYC